MYLYVFREREAAAARVSEKYARVYALTDAYVLFLFILKIKRNS